MSSAVFAHPVQQPSIRSAGLPIAATLRSAGSVIAVWETRARTRAALRRVDAALHADLGLSAADIRREVSKPFWRA